ncbi:MAG: hypothetical protein M3Z00_00395 [Actinomycetota bacterium]|nr:hypothetical protein [Actinomycetota bacterium]
MSDTASEERQPADSDQQRPTELQRDTAASGQPDGSELTTAQVATLMRLLRVAYPHPTFPDAPYERTAKTVQDADADNLLATGLDDLDQRAGGNFGALSDAEATAVVERIADGRFFKLVHSTTVVALYDDHEVWDLLGYQGSSFDKGGYLDRGFDDLDWLPTPRIAENSEEKRDEIVLPSAPAGQGDG